jgi:hypothetical protein
VKIENVYLGFDDPYPMLHLTVDGEDVWLGPEAQKPDILAAGFVHLGGKLGAQMPRHTYTGPGGPLELEGYTDDPEIVRLFRNFIKYINDEIQADALETADGQMGDATP